MAESFYDVLDVGADASQADIQGAYRTKVKEYHPDVSDHPDAAEYFQVVVRAEEVLGDPDERARYDDLGHDGYLRVTGMEGLGSFANEAESSDSEAGEGERVWGAPGEGRYDRSTRWRNRGSSSSRSSTSAGARTSGYDPWEKTRPGSGNPTQRGYSPWNETDDDEAADSDDPWEGKAGEDLFGAATGATGGSSARASTASGTATGPGGRSRTVAGGARRRQRRPRGAHVASTGKNGRAGGFWSAEVDPDSFQPESDVWGLFDPLRTQSGAMLTTVFLFVYPVFVFFSVTPALPVTANLVIAGATALVVVFMLTEPGISLIVFGTWGVVAPFFLLFIRLAWLSPLGLAILGAFWGPLLLTILFSMALPD